MSDDVKLCFKAANDTLLSVMEKLGPSFMEVAVMSKVPGMGAECGGCATCHVVSPADLRSVADDEDAMLDDTVMPRTTASRLSCIMVESEIEKAIFAIPPAQ